MKKTIPILFLLPLLIALFAFDKPEIAASADINWHSMKEAQKLADENGRKVFVYAHAEWCVYCKRMEKEVFPEKTVQETLEKHYYPVEVDIDSKEEITFNGSTMTKNEFAIKYRVTATPTSFFIDPEGNILGVQPGYIPVDIFTSLLEYVGTDAFKNQKFADYLNNKGKGTTTDGN